MRIKKGDTVVVTSGKYRGKKGKVLKVFPKQERAIVEDVNIMKKHQKPTQQMQQGGIIEQEAPIHISNLMYFDSKVNSGTRVGYKFLDDGTKVRYSKKSGEVID